MQQLYFHSLLILSREVYTSGQAVLPRPFSREAQPVIVDEIQISQLTLGKEQLDNLAAETEADGEGVQAPRKLTLWA